MRIYLLMSCYFYWCNVYAANIGQIEMKTPAKWLFQNDLITIQNGERRVQEVFLVPQWHSGYEDPFSLKNKQKIFGWLFPKNNSGRKLRVIKELSRLVCSVTPSKFVTQFDKLSQEAGI